LTQPDYHVCSIEFVALVARQPATSTIPPRWIAPPFIRFFWSSLRWKA